MIVPWTLIAHGGLHRVVGLDQDLLANLAEWGVGLSVTSIMYPRADLVVASSSAFISRDSTPGAPGSTRPAG